MHKAGPPREPLLAAKHRLTRRILVLFAVLVMAIALNGLYSVLQGRQSAAQKLQQEVFGKLNLSLALLRAEQEKFQQLSLAVREYATQLAGLLEYDHYRGVQILLRQQAALYDIDLVLLSGDEGLLISSIIPPDAGSSTPGVTFAGGMPPELAALGPGLVSLPSGVLRRWLPGLDRGATVVGFASKVRLFYEGGDPAGTILMLRLLNRRPALFERIARLTGGEVVLFDAGSTPLAGSIEVPAGGWQTKGWLELRDRTLYARGGELRDPGGRVVGRLYLALDAEPFFRAQWRLILTNLSPVLITLILVSLLFLFLRNRVFVRIAALDRALQTVADGDLRLRLPLRRPSPGKGDEIDLMDANFNLMMDRLEASARHVQKSWEATQRLNRKLSQENRERRRTQDALRLAKRQVETASQAKTIFLANMSHEIRTPLNAILGYAQILRRGGGLDDKQRHAVETIEGSGNHLLVLINDILDLSKIEAGRMELHPDPFELAGLLEELGALFGLRCQEKGVAWRLELDLPGRPFTVWGDAGKLRQILINLLGNAVKFTDRGEVTLRVDRSDRARYRFCVEDSGPGIPDSARREVFEAFSQTSQGVKKGGTGLGLAIARSQVELMGGRLELDSELGRGSRFSFELELPLAESERPAEREPQVEIALRSECRVQALVVDDEPENREVLSRLLESLGISVVQAADGRDGLERMRGCPADILFVDYRMPELDGVQMVVSVRETCGEDLPIVMLTASVLEQEWQQFLDAGCNRFIAKPFRLEEVFSALQTLLPDCFVAVDEARHPEQPVADVADLRALIPEPLLGQLSEAAEYCMITDLQHGLEQLEALGPEQTQVARRLRDLAQEYKMEQIAAILNDGE
jgi:signal transduction histidine kinase/DNA-binding NarL/FixJ family response regulator